MLGKINRKESLIDKELQNSNYNRRHNTNGVRYSLVIRNVENVKYSGGFSSTVEDIQDCGGYSVLGRIFSTLKGNQKHYRFIRNSGADNLINP